MLNWGVKKFDRTLHRAALEGPRTTLPGKSLPPRGRVRSELSTLPLRGHRHPPSAGHSLNASDHPQTSQEDVGKYISSTGIWSDSLWAESGWSICLVWPTFLINELPSKFFLESVLFIETYFNVRDFERYFPLLEILPPPLPHFSIFKNWIRKYYAFIASTVQLYVFF